ncbi:MAG TPA: hydrogen peroxide-dependent heme synthase [Terriglobales bacterium]|nr:hydrogen peroxide-dependent heme synthase [Terriglobales bacterium]
MSAINSRTEIARGQMPAVPLTIEGSSVLHQMMRFRWSAWRALSPAKRAEIVRAAVPVLKRMEMQDAERSDSIQSALYSLLGHKGDLMLVHFRSSFEDLHRAEIEIAKLELSDYLETSNSYLSMVELGLYDSTVKLYESLAGRGIEPHSAQWVQECEELLDRQREAMKTRLYPPIPDTRYVCFYPMDRRRGEDKNWYTLPIVERQRQMHEHGMVGRRYAGEVRQIITASIGFDDWEWGVDLFADHPLVFKKLIYEMRFDEVSAVYALFGSFFVGLRVPAEKLPELLQI